MVDESNTNYANDDGILYDKAKTNLLQVPGGKSSVSIPASVTSIGNYAFAMCPNLRSLTIPAGVTTIGSWAFAYSKGFSSITIPASVTTMGFAVFLTWEASQTINVPFANEDARPAEWEDSWNTDCNATIVYQQ